MNDKLLKKPNRTLSHFEELVNIPTEDFVGYFDELKQDPYIRMRKLEKVAIERLKDFIDEYPLLSDEMIKSLISAFEGSQWAYVKGFLVHTRLLSFINSILGDYMRQTQLQNPNEYDLKLIVELRDLHSQAKPKVQ